MRKILVFLILGIGLGFLSVLHASENTLTFVISPPPIGYPEFEKGVRDYSAGGNFIYARTKLQDTTLNVLGATGFMNYQECPYSKLAFSGNVNGGFLIGNKYDLTLWLLSIQPSVAYQIDLSPTFSMFLIGGVGMEVSITTMTVEIPQVINSLITIDPTTVYTTQAVYHPTIGLQINMEMGSFIFSPFGMYTYTTGSYWVEQKSAMSFTYPSFSGNLDAFSSTVIGFDLLYKPFGVSLSSLTHFRPDTTLLSIALKWLLSR
ncbi:MAG: hypothetical protein SNJ78_09600 [Spirochaetales bacterium]